MIILLPLSRFTVLYEVGSGRPHSRLETLMLAAIRADNGTVTELRDVFKIHPRLITQALVNLIQDGYVAMGADRYVLTEDGHDVVAHGARRRESVLARTTTIIMERALGLLAPTREVRYVGRREVEALPAEARKMTPAHHAIRLDEAQVRHLLLRGPAEWIRSVGDIRLIGKEGHWLPVQVDLENEAVVGMPDRWQVHLRPVLLEKARAYVAAGAGAMTDDERDWLRRSSASARAAWSPASDELDRVDIPVSYDASSAVTSRERARETLEAVVSQASSGDTVLLATPLLDEVSVHEWREAFAEAVRRGASVNVLWHEAVPDARDAARKLAWDLRDWSFSVNKEAAPIALGCFMTVRADGGTVTFLGNVPWMTSEELAPGDTAIEFREPGVAARALQIAATAWRKSRGGALAAPPQRFLSLATELERRATEDGTVDDRPSHTVQLAIRAEAAAAEHAGGDEDVLLRCGSETSSAFAVVVRQAAEGGERGQLARVPA